MSSPAVGNVVTFTLIICLHYGRRRPAIPRNRPHVVLTPKVVDVPGPPLWQRGNLAGVLMKTHSKALCRCARSHRDRYIWARPAADTMLANGRADGGVDLAAAGMCPVQHELRDDHRHKSRRFDKGWRRDG